MWYIFSSSCLHKRFIWSYPYSMLTMFSWIVSTYLRYIYIYIFNLSASGLDSRLAFDSNTIPCYASVINKAIPKLTAFTIAFWVKIRSSSHPGTVLSYSSQEGAPDVLRIRTGPSLTLQVHDEEIKPGFMLNQSHWTHLAWTWTSKGWPG